MKLYPLHLQRHLDDRLWGGNRLVGFLNLTPPYPERVAESWQVYDDNLILNGPLAGQTLATVTREHGEKLVGSLSIPRYGADFPLLAKFIDAQQDLSIQVHPDDDYAHSVEADTGFHGKSEAWYILDADPGASLYYHLARPVSRAAFEAAVHDQTLTDLLNKLPVTAGDVVYVPAGTVHTINAGTMLFEIQQKSDLTYRVYDYGRPRPLHLKKALDVIDFDSPPPPPVKPLHTSADGTRTLLLATRHFAMERWTIAERLHSRTRPTSLEILTVIKGGGRLDWETGDLKLQRGESVVLPAELGDFGLQATQADLTILRCWVPDLDRNVIPHLKELGASPADINRVVRV